MIISPPSCLTPDTTETAFYAAFMQCDLAAMERLWADDDVICVHPGWHALIGHAEVVRGWAQIFAGSELPDLQVNVISKSISDTLAVHVMEEYISTGENQSAVVLATNVYRKYGDDWRMVQHHGSVVHTQVAAHTIQ